NAADGEFSVVVADLMPATVYYYKAFATDGFATVYGNQMSFVTADIAEPTATPASDITASSFMANWDAVPGATGYRLDVSTSETFGSSTFATDLFFSEYVEGSSN